MDNVFNPTFKTQQGANHPYKTVAQGRVQERQPHHPGARMRKGEYTVGLARV